MQSLIPQDTINIKIMDGNDRNESIKLPQPQSVFA